MQEKEAGWKNKSLIKIAISLALLLTGLYIEFILKKEIIGHFLYVIVVIISGHKIIRKGFTKLVKKRKFDMNFLMSAAAIGAFFIGYPEEGASVMLLFFIAETLENYAGERNRNSMTALMNIAPKKAIVIRNKSHYTVHVHKIARNEIIAVKLVIGFLWMEL